jgi:hypothetical protein
VDAYLEYAQLSKTTDGFARWLRHSVEHDRQEAPS